MKLIKKIIVHVFLKMKNIKKKNTIKSYNVDRSIKLGKYSLIGKNVEISSNVSVGDFTYFNSNQNWSIIESNTVFGKFCSIAPGVIIGVGNHDYKNVTTHPIVYNKYYFDKIKKNIIQLKQNGLVDANAETVIGNDVWIGMNANIKRGIKIGDGAIIGMNSVVTKDVPPYAIVAGVPAKIISYRFKEDEIKLLLDNPWWNLDYEQLMEKYNYLYDINDYIKMIKEGLNDKKDK